MLLNLTLAYLTYPTCLRDQNEEIYQKAISILEKYFGVEDEEEGQADIAPQIADGQYQFNAGANQGYIHT